MNQGKWGLKKRLCRMAGIAMGIAVVSGMIVPEIAWGGNLNANEAELMGIARGTFTYDGVTYRAKDAYINEAYYYLIRDDIDVTDEQKAAAIQKVYASVKQGIDEGYLYPVGGIESTVEETLDESGEALSESSPALETSEGTEKNPQLGSDLEKPSGSSLLGLGENEEGQQSEITEATKPTEKNKDVEETEPEITIPHQIEALEHMSEFLAEMETETVSSVQLFPEKKNALSLEDMLNASNWLMGVLSGVLAVSFAVIWKEKLFFHHHRKDKKKEGKLRE